MAYRTNFWENDWGNNRPRKPIRKLKKEVNNERMQDSAEVNAWWMRRNPSFLEKMMMEFLDNNHIQYEFQKIFYIAGKNKYIEQYYIADFYIPSRRTIIEVDGKFHEQQKKYDSKRTELIKQYHKKVKVIRIKYPDFKNAKKLNDLLTRIK